MHPRRRAAKLGAVPRSNRSSTLALPWRGASKATSELSDAELVERIGKGDRGAMEVVYQANYARVLRVSWRILGSREEAEDIAQDVFVRAWDALRSFEPRARISTWLYRVTVNASLDRLKTRRRRHARLSDLPARAPAETADNALSLHQQRRLLADAVARLPEKYRVVIVLRDIEGRPYAEMEQILDLPQTTLKMRAVRGRQQLQKLVSRMVPEGLNP